MVTRARRDAGAARDLRLARERRILDNFIGVYCRAHHGTLRGELCRECAGLLRYAVGRLARCPYDPKPKCKHCPTHCYNAGNRARIREVMRFAGMWYVRRGRLDWLVRYFMT